MGTILTVGDLRKLVKEEVEKQMTEEQKLNESVDSMGIINYIKAHPGCDLQDVAKVFGTSTEMISKTWKNEKKFTNESKKPSAGLTKKKKSAVVKKAKAGENIGEKGKEFKEIEKKAKESGAKDPKAVAGAALFKNTAKKKGK